MKTSALKGEGRRPEWYHALKTTIGIIQQHFGVEQVLQGPQFSWRVPVTRALQQNAAADIASRWDQSAGDNPLDRIWLAHGSSSDLS